MNTRNRLYRLSTLAVLAFMCFPLLAIALVHPAASTGALMAGFMFAPIRLQKAEGEGEGGSGSGPVDPAAALAQVENTALPIGQRLSVAMNALRGIDPTSQLAALQGKLDTAQQTITAHEATIAANATKITALEASNVAFADQVSALTKTNTELSSKEQDLQKRAAALAKEKVGSLGFSSGKLPGNTDALPGETGSKAVYEKFRKETNPDKKALLFAEYNAALAAEKKPIHGPS
jgi:hypothetical protein